MKYPSFVLVLLLVSGCARSWPTGLENGKEVSVLLSDGTGNTGYTGTVKAKEGDWLVLDTVRGEVRIAREKILSVKEGRF